MIHGLDPSELEKKSESLHTILLCSPTHTHTHSLTHSLTHSHTHPLTHSLTFTHLLHFSRQFTHSLIRLVTTTLYYPLSIQIEAKKHPKSAGSSKKEKTKKGKEKEKKEKSKEKSKNKEELTKEEKKPKEKPKDKQKSKPDKSKTKNSFSLIAADGSPTSSKGKENNKPKGGRNKAPPTRPAPSPPGKLMTVVPTPPSERKELQLKSSKPTATSKEFKLKSQPVTSQPASGEAVTSVGVSVGKQKPRPLSIEPREMKINFGDLDSSSDDEEGAEEEGAVLITGANRLSNSMEDLFCE